MISIWGAVVCLNLFIHFVVPNPQYQKSPFYLHFPSIPYNQIEFNSPQGLSNIPPWFQQPYFDLQNQTTTTNGNNNVRAQEQTPRVGTLRLRVANPSSRNINQPSQNWNNNETVVYFLSGPWGGGQKGFTPLNRNLDNSIITTTPANLENSRVTPLGINIFNQRQQSFNKQQQFNRQQQQFNPQQSFLPQQQLDQLQFYSQQQQNQNQQQSFDGAQEQPSQIGTASPDENNGFQSGFGWNSWADPDEFSPEDPSVRSFFVPAKSFMTRNQDQGQSTPSTTTTTKTTTSTINTSTNGTTTPISRAQERDPVEKLRRLISRIREVTRQELRAQVQRRSTSSRPINRSTQVRTSTTTEATTTEPQPQVANVSTTSSTLNPIPS